MPQFSDHLRNALCRAFMLAIGKAPVIEIIDGDMPAKCSIPTDGVALVSFNLSNDWQLIPVCGVVETAGLPYTTTAAHKGRARYYRIFDAAGVCHEQGGCWMEGDDTPEHLRDLLLDNTDIREQQSVQLLEFTKIAPGA